MNAGGQHQGGATLIVALVMLSLITLLVVNAFSLSSSSLKAVTNMQLREEAVAAANKALEQVVSSNFTSRLAPQSVNVDMNQDGNSDYTVAVARPVCVRATQASAGAPSDVELGAAMASGGAWHTDWELKASVDDPVLGGRATVTQGISVLLSQAQKAVACP
jgi:Tfp pilus assembly protein PilX